ncbi:MAG: hypothetical protein GYA24_14380 [Candidatus Lokiarchaeota archaeon]|nr:hypothetical protein [Candidatus Lokiarchaeota archaeon]
MDVKKRTLTILALAVLVTCIGLASSARAGELPDAYEPNETVATARAITQGTHACNFDRMGDVDYYNITIPAGQEITIDITATSVLSVTLLGTSGPIVMANLPPNQARLTHVATYTGNHTIYATGTGIYTLVITIATPGSDLAMPGYEPLSIALASCMAIAIVYMIARSTRKIQA